MAHALSEPVTGVLNHGLHSIAHLHAQHFAKVSNICPLLPAFFKSKAVAESHPLSFDGRDSFTHKLPFTSRELKDALAHCASSASGPDGLPYAQIHHLDSHVLVVLLSHHNQMWISGNFPPEWHPAFEFPIPKYGKELTLPINSRPISLTECLCKLMEKMINPQLVMYAVDKHLTCGGPNPIGLHSPSPSGCCLF